MPKLELGDLKKVEKMKDANIPVFLQAIEEGYDIIGPIPSCVLMYKQELPLMFPEEESVAKVKAHFFDPFEYLMLRHKESLIDTAFPTTTWQGCLSCGLPPAGTELWDEDPGLPAVDSRYRSNGY
jgi:Fe-S oxidoreductase